MSTPENEDYQPDPGEESMLPSSPWNAPTPDRPAHPESEDSISTALDSRLSGTTKEVIKIEDDDDITMLDAAPSDMLRSNRPTNIASPSIVDDLQICFKPANAKFPAKPRRWGHV